MTLAVSAKWGLPIVRLAVLSAVAVSLSWTSAASRGLGDEFVQGLRSIPSLLWAGLKLAIPGGERR